METDDFLDWHRWFGLILKDFFRDTPVTVEVEFDLSQKKQLLDVVIIRKEAASDLVLPDGFGPLAEHNVVSFKSFHEPLNTWALQELIGHYVNYRKQSSPSMRALLPADQFRRIAVCVRYPDGLVNNDNEDDRFALEERSPGVYDIHYGGPLRIIVVHRLPRQDQNALLHLFSHRQDLVEFGGTHYQIKSPEATSVLQQLVDRYRTGGVVMPYTFLDLINEKMPGMYLDMPPEMRERVLRALPVEERIRLLGTLPSNELAEAMARLPSEERARLLGSLPSEERARLLGSLPSEERARLLGSLPSEERASLLGSLPSEERARFLGSLPPKQRVQGLTLDDILSSLSEEQRAALRRRLEQEPPPASTE